MSLSTRIVGPSSKAGSAQHARIGSVTVGKLEYEECDGCGRLKPAGAPHAARWSADARRKLDCSGRDVTELPESDS